MLSVLLTESPGHPHDLGLMVVLIALAFTVEVVRGVGSCLGAVA